MRMIQKVHCGFIDVVNDLKTQGVIDRDYGIARRLLEVVREVHTSLSTRQEIINEAKHHKDPRMVKSVAFFREQQAKDLNLMNDLMLKISETQLRTFDKHEFIGYAKKNLGCWNSYEFFVYASVFLGFLI
ncbi:hypothetical protein Tco_1383033 [Tanacetum coccineum]